MSSTSNQPDDSQESASDVMPKPIKPTRRKQTKHIHKEKSNTRRDACNAIIAKTLPMAGASGDNLSSLVTLYEDMVSEIASQYLEGDLKKDNAPTPDSKLATTYIVLEIIQVLVKQIPIFSPICAMIWTFYIGQVAIDFYEKQITKDQISERTSSLVSKYLSKGYTRKRSKQMSIHSDNKGIITKTFEENIRSTAERLHMPDPDTKDIARDALLALDTFLKARAPVITVTGITFTGKSRLINRLFGEKKSKEGLIADTTDKVVTIRFNSGLLIYDTPGAGGINVKLENTTRAFLGLQQLEKDVNGKALEPIVEIPTIDAHNYNSATNKPVALKKQEEFERTDLYLFVVNITAGGLQRQDLLFFREVVELGKPVIVVINKIDIANQESVKECLTYIQENLARHAIALSAEKGQNIQELVSTIVTSLPSNCQTVLGETINKEYKKLVRHQEIGIYSLTTAIKVARLVGMRGKDNARLMTLLVLGLYAWIVSEYELSVTDTKLKEVGASFSDLLSIIEEKLSNAQNLDSNVGSSVLLGTAVGVVIAGLAVTGVGAAIPVVLAAIGGGVIGGGGSGAIIGTLKDFFNRRSASDIEVESQSLKQFISDGNKHETVASVFAFGVSLRECCDMLEQGKGSASFLEIFEREYVHAYDSLKPFSNELNQNRMDNDENLIRELSQIMFRKSDSLS